MSNTTNEEYYIDEIGVIPMTPAVQIPSAIVLSILILIGISGNSMTIAAYFTDRKLNSIYNFFICNLALTDLLICGIGMTFYAVYTLKEFVWPFGYSFCKVWLVLDFTFCLESILLMLILSVDRLLMIKFGPTYINKMTIKLSCYLLAASWVISFLVYGPAIIGWNHWVGYSTVKYMKCHVEFAHDFAYTTATAILEFVLPFICLTSINGVIHYKIRQRLNRSVHTRRLPLKHLKPSMTRTNDSTSQNDTERVQRSNEADISVESILSNNQSHANSTDIGNGNSADMSEERETGNKPGRQMKAAKFLAVLVGAFLILWAPYTVATLIISFCNNCVNGSLYAFFNFLLYMKSTVNPFLYALNSSRYRKQFMKYLTLNNRLYKLRSMESDRRVNTTH